jgi:hypothetical protein
LKTISPGSLGEPTEGGIYPPLEDSTGAVNKKLETHKIIDVPQILFLSRVVLIRIRSRSSQPVVQLSCENYEWEISQDADWGTLKVAQLFLRLFAQK